MKSIFTLALVIISGIAHAKYRLIDMKRELSEASFVGELILLKYNFDRIPEYSKRERKMILDSLTGKEYTDSSYIDSINVPKSIIFINPKNGDTLNFSVYQYFQASYRARPDTLPSRFPSIGYWPKISDTSLVIVDNKGSISFFGLKENDTYVFWDPYWNSSWNTIFIFDKPFSPYISKKIVNDSKAYNFTMEIEVSDQNKLKTEMSASAKMNYEFAERRAKEAGRNSFAYFHCAIKNDLFWSEYHKLKP